MNTNNEINISVTALAEYVCRCGDLSGGNFDGVSGIEGTRLHQRIFSDIRKEYGDNLQTEVPFRTVFEDDSKIKLNISGRADCVIGGSPKRIIEIKSFNSTVQSYERLERQEHLAQLKLYGVMMLNSNPNLDEVSLTLRYVSITTLEAFEKEFTLNRTDSDLFFTYICSEYMSFATSIINYDVNSLETIRNMKFPYDTIRKGQKEFMKSALNSLCSKEVLLVEAPTGTGKTISTLYPAIKGLIRNKYQKIFYLTAKTATRGVAVKAINDMRKNGLLIRSILLASKESMCPKGTKCDAKYCIYAKGYYQRLKPALNEVLMHDDINPELIGRIAMRNKICPHELSLDALLFCHVVIGDYNHAFDPRVSLVRCFDTGNDDANVVLVDEAHNLVDRARTMYSASFSMSLIKDTIEQLKGRNLKLEEYLRQTLQYFEVAFECLSKKRPLFKILEGTEENRCISCDNWEGTRKAPHNLYAILWKTCRFLSPFIEELGPGEVRQKAMEYFFEARFFLTIIEQHYNDSYITYFTMNEGDVVVTLDCLDCSSKLDQQIKDKLAVVMFSATLSPYEYYRNVLIGEKADYVRHISLPSPFPPENLEIILETKIGTTYKERGFTIDKIAQRVVAELNDRRGNFMIFFPSFDYMEKVMSSIENKFERLSADDKVKRRVILQKRNMLSFEKEEYLNCFSSPFDGVFLGAAVLGGHFGEGIDLVGDRLSGVIVVGVGIPQLSPEREVLSNYYSEKFGDGYAFAYRYPGWEKVLQAVGRVIRTKDDEGFALLIDSRLEKPEYLILYPENWQI